MTPESGALAFAVLGRPLVARRVPARLAAWLRESWDYSGHAAARSGYAIELNVTAAAPSGAPHAWPELDVAVPGRTLRFRSEGSVWETGEEASGLRLELGGSGARIALWGWEAEGDGAARYHALYVAMSEALRASGLVPLHAAVAARGDDAVAWLGASGVGKSTTLLHAAAAGWRPVAEDLCWLEPAALAAYGWDRGVRCWPETLRRFFPDLAGARPAPDGKLLIGYERLGGAPSRDATLARLALLERVAGSPTHWEAVAPRDLVKALWEATGVPLSRHARDTTAAAVERLSRLPAARLVLGDTPPRLAGALAGEFAQVRGG